VADTDEGDVVAFKRFLLGGTDYRNERLKIIPSVVEAPYAVKMVAPGKRGEITVVWLDCAGVPLDRFLCAGIPQLCFDCV
jgi:hypothetical protein